MEICRQINAKSSIDYRCVFSKNNLYSRTTQPTSTKNSFFKSLKDLWPKDSIFGVHSKILPSVSMQILGLRVDPAHMGFSRKDCNTQATKNLVIYGNLYLQHPESYGFRSPVWHDFLMYRNVFCFWNKCIWERNLQIRRVFLKIHRVSSHVARKQQTHSKKSKKNTCWKSAPAELCHYPEHDHIFGNQEKILIHTVQSSTGINMRPVWTMGPDQNLYTLIPDPYTSIFIRGTRQHR